MSTEARTLDTSAVSAKRGGETQVLEPEGLPQVDPWPAPWDLRASAYLLAVRMPESFTEAQAFAPPSLAGRMRGRIAYVMAVDYSVAPCGPYRELIFAPVFQFDDGRHASITRIYVSSYGSVVNGRRNWGIPKDQADITRETTAGADHWQLGRAGASFGELQFETFGPSLPVFSGILPSSLRTLVQHWRGQEYRYLVSGKGSMRLAKLRSSRFDPAFFPELQGASVLATFALPTMQLAFPTASILAL